MIKHIIGIAGLDKKNLKILNKKYKKFSFIKLSDNNFFKYQKNIKAIIIYREGQVTNALKKFFLEKKFKDFKNLEWFHLSRAGVDEFSSSFDKIEFILTCGKKVQGPNVSEHCLAMLLYLTRNLNSSNSQKIIEIYNKKALVVGLGSIGISIAEKLSSFGVKVSAVIYSSKPIYSFINEIYSTNDLTHVVGKFDIIINSCALTNKTRNLFNNKIFLKMKKGVYFLNVSRGEVVNTKDLVKNLNKFSGIGLDVLDIEPIPRKHILRNKKNVLLTEHTAGISDNLKRRYDLIIKNLYLFQCNKKLLNVVNLKEGY